MKPTTLLAAAAAGLFLSSVSCERHSWEETKALHEQHGHSAHGDHGDSHGHGEKHEGGDHHHSEEKAH